jgi:2,4-dienoyl-CoA reductase-like NADH-dependent reductase (Old Yellow Enzyme family)
MLSPLSQRAEADAASRWRICVLSTVADPVTVSQQGCRDTKEESMRAAKPNRREFIELSMAGAAGATIASTLVGRAEAKARTGYTLFSPGAIAGMEVKNRLVRSATWESAGENGMPTETYLEIYRDLAAGGVGMIITGYVAPTPSVIGVQIHINDDKFMDGLAKIADTVHKIDPACKLVAEVGDGGATISPSGLGWPGRGGEKRELEVAEIEKIVAQFAEGIRRLKDTGFDGAELHGAHAYLLSSFLSDITNKRTDRYGGSVHKRVQIIREIMDQSRKKVGDFPIFIKVNSNDAGTPHDVMDEGITPANFPELAMELEKAGVDAIDVSGNGCMYADIDDVDDEIYFLPYAEQLTDLEIPVIVTGGNRTVDHMEKTINTAKVVDFFGISRPLVREPDLPGRWMTGEGESKPRGINCNQCIFKAIRQGPLHCMQEAMLNKKPA